VLLVAVIPTATLLGHAAMAGAQQPGLTLSSNSGSVGAYVAVSFVAPANTSCSTPIFTTGVLGSAYAQVIPLNRGIGQNFNGRFLIPPYIPHLGPVTTGTYEFLVDCGPASGPEQDYTAPFEVTSVTPSPSRFVGLAPTPSGTGYWLAQAGGGVFSFGTAAFYGSLPGSHLVPASAIVGIAATPDGGGYWLVAADGGVFAFGDGSFYGSLPAIGITPAAPIVGIAANPEGGGYWLVGADGSVFAFGSSAYYGSVSQAFNPGGPVMPVAGIAAAPDGAGYLEAGGFFGGYGYGDLAGSYPIAPPPNVSPPSMSPLTGVAATASGLGQWYVAPDGAVFAVGTPFYGSLPGDGVTSEAPILDIAATADHRGYWLLGADGGVFAFGDAGYDGSAADAGLPW